MKNGFNNSDLSIATESFIRHLLEQKSAKLREWSHTSGMQNGARRKAGEIQGIQEVLNFMIANRK